MTPLPRLVTTVAALAVLGIVSGRLSASTVAGPEPVTTSELAGLRAKVDAAAADLEAERAATRDELAALRAERTDLERQLRAETAQAATLQALADEAANRAAQLDDKADRWHEPTKAAIEATRAYVRRSLPFALAERLETLDTIERDLATANPDYARAGERVLRFIEQEEAMGGEVALTQHKLQLDGQLQIVDVLRLGMALAYLRTADGGYGWMYPTETGHVTALVDDPELVRAIRARFEAHEDNRGLGPADLVLPVQVPGPRGGA